MGIELELGFLLVLQLIGTEIFAPFEVETSPSKRILKGQSSSALLSASTGSSAMVPSDARSPRDLLPRLIPRRSLHRSVHRPPVRALSAGGGGEAEVEVRKVMDVEDFGDGFTPNWEIAKVKIG